MGRAPCCEKIGLKKGRWTEEEDDKLIKYIQQYGEGSWRSLPKNAGLLRCGKSCRLRWVNYLKLNVKRGNITPKEEELILKLHATLGNRWSVIAGHLPGRTDNEIKNYWISHLSRKIHTVQRKGENIVINVVDVGLPPKRRGGRIRGAEMQGNKSTTINPLNNNINTNHVHYEENEKEEFDIEEIMGHDGLLEDSIVSPLGPNVSAIGPYQSGSSSSSFSPLYIDHDHDHDLKQEMGMVYDGQESRARWGEKHNIISWLFDDEEDDDEFLRENVSNLVEWLLS